MNATITENSISFVKTFDSKEGSERQSNARGLNTPDLLTIKHQDAKDNVYGGKTKRRMLRIDRISEDADGDKYATSGYIVLVTDERSTTTDSDDVLATLRAIVGNTTSGTEYLEQLLNNER